MIVNKLLSLSLVYCLQKVGLLPSQCPSLLPLSSCDMLGLLRMLPSCAWRGLLSWPRSLLPFHREHGEHSRCPRCCYALSRLTCAALTGQMRWQVSNSRCFLTCELLHSYTYAAACIHTRMTHMLLPAFMHACSAFIHMCYKHVLQ